MLRRLIWWSSAPHSGLRTKCCQGPATRAQRASEPGEDAEAPLNAGPQRWAAQRRAGSAKPPSSIAHTRRHGGDARLRQRRAIRARQVRLVDGGRRPAARPRPSGGPAVHYPACGREEECVATRPQSARQRRPQSALARPQSARIGRPAGGQPPPPPPKKRLAQVETTPGTLERPGFSSRRRRTRPSRACGRPSAQEKELLKREGCRGRAERALEGATTKWRQSAELAKRMSKVKKGQTTKKVDEEDRVTRTPTTSSSPLPKKKDVRGEPLNTAGRRRCFRGRQGAVAAPSSGDGFVLSPARPAFSPSSEKVPQATAR